MVGYLLDTCVLSELQKPNGNPAVRDRVSKLDPEQTFVSVITIGEITKGILMLPDGRRKREFQTWQGDFENAYSENLIPVDFEIARVWGETTARAISSGFQLPQADGLIAATALHHNLTMLTRNTKDFAIARVPIIDPWES